MLHKHTFTFLTLFCLIVAAFLLHANDLGRVYVLKNYVHVCMKTRNKNVHQRLSVDRKLRLHNGKH